MWLGRGHVFRKLCAKCSKDYSASYLARHIGIFKGQRTTANQPTAIANLTLTPLDGEEGNVSFSFDIENALMVRQR